MRTANISSYLRGNRFLTLGQPYEFDLEINNIPPLVQIYKITLYLENLWWTWSLNSNQFPYHLKKKIDLPLLSNSYYPKFQVEGFNNDGFSQVVDLYFPRPVISTSMHPIFDARLARSNSPKDVPLINPMRKLLNIWGFDCSTLGIEVQTQQIAGTDFIQCEKEWASQGDCFIGILTQRDISQQTGEGLPPPWTYVESGMAFSEKKPMFAFVEKGVKSEAIFNYFDNVHKREFYTSDLGNSLVGIDNDLIRLRKEIETYRVGRSINNILDVGTKALAIIGGITIITGLMESFPEG